MPRWALMNNNLWTNLWKNTCLGELWWTYWDQPLWFPRYDRHLEEQKLSWNLHHLHLQSSAPVAPRLINSIQIPTLMENPSLDSWIPQEKLQGSSRISTDPDEPLGILKNFHRIFRILHGVLIYLTSKVYTNIKDIIPLTTLFHDSVSIHQMTTLEVATFAILRFYRTFAKLYTLCGRLILLIKNREIVFLRSLARYWLKIKKNCQNLYENQKI